jgi:predicted aspartyl protease
MRLNSNAHFDVEGALNGHATRFLVDTGSTTTLIDTQVAVKSGTRRDRACGLRRREAPATWSKA